MAYNARVNVTQLEEDSPTAQGEYNAYLNVKNPYGGIGVWCSVHQIHYLVRVSSIIQFVVFKSEACAKEWIESQIENFGEDFEIIEID